MRTALGFRPHTGWACAVALGGAVGSPGVLARCRLELSGPSAPWQPYHAAAALALDAATDLLTEAERVAGAVAAEAVAGWVGELVAAGHEVIAAGVPIGRYPVPPSLVRILASHPLMHAAEGELFRGVLVEAVATLGVVVYRVPVDALAAQVRAEVGCSEEELRAMLTGFGREVGPPWRRDEKDAALAAWVALAGAQEAAPTIG